MIRNILFVSLWSVSLFYSCIDDDSTLPIKDISEITIKAQSDTINIDFGYELVFEPEIEQAMKNMELTYEWSYHGYVLSSIGGFLKDSLRFLSNEKVLRHAFKKLGEYKLRLKVSNAHGSSYKYYTLFVKAAFDQGIFVLSANDIEPEYVGITAPVQHTQNG